MKQQYLQKSLLPESSKTCIAFHTEGVECLELLNSLVYNLSLQDRWHSIHFY